MKSFSLYVVILISFAVVWAQPKKDPGNIVFTAKTGNVTFDHKKHTERVKGDCKACHPAVFPESRAPINYKAAIHKTAEAAKTACATCHVEGGKSFVSKGNCNRCHVKAAAKS